MPHSSSRSVKVHSFLRSTSGGQDRSPMAYTYSGLLTQQDRGVGQLQLYANVLP